jgi:hypothetical protein
MSIEEAIQMLEKLVLYFSDPSGSCSSLESVREAIKVTQDYLSANNMSTRAKPQFGATSGVITINKAMADTVAILLEEYQTAKNAGDAKNGLETILAPKSDTRNQKI